MRLRGYRATTHWLSLDLLRLFGAEPVEARVVRDRNRVTGAGVTAGMGFGLALAAELFDVSVAQRIRLASSTTPRRRSTAARRARPHRTSTRPSRARATTRSPNGARSPSAPPFVFADPSSSSCE